MATRILSTPTTVSVFAPPSPANWGSGSSAGTYANDLWTPGKDASGAVNLVSWNLVPLNRWVEVAGTRLDGLDSVVKAAVPGWRDYGSWDGVTNAWNGMTWDDRTGLERGWLAVCGGHSDSSNDGIYRLDLRKMAWNVQRMPQDPNWWPASYKSSGSYTNFPPAVSYYQANNTNAEGVYGDEFFVPGDPAHSSRSPTARHTYGSTVFVPSLGAAGKILMGCRRYWEYDLATNAWATPKFPFGNAAGYNSDGAKGYTGENMQAWFDEVEGRYYVCATQNYGSSQTWSVQPGGTGWRWEGGYPIGGYESFYTAQEKRNRTLWTLVYDVVNNRMGSPRVMLETRLDSPRITQSIAVRLGATLASAVFGVSNYWDGQAMTFVPDVNKWLCNIFTDTGSMVWCWLDAATWTLELANIPGASPTVTSPYVETKIKYLPDLHALVWVKTASQNVRLIRFA
jgi:hypothetical protein